MLGLSLHKQKSPGDTADLYVFSVCEGFLQSEFAKKTITTNLMWQTVGSGKKRYMGNIEDVKLSINRAKQNTKTTQNRSSAVVLFGNISERRGREFSLKILQL